MSEIPACSELGALLMQEGASVVDGAILTSLCLSIHLPHRSGPGGLARWFDITIKFKQR